MLAPNPSPMAISDGTACSAQYTRQSRGHRGSHGLLGRARLGCDMLLPIQPRGLPDGRADCVNARLCIYTCTGYDHTGSSKVSQNSRSITVTTRPGFSGVPRWSVLFQSVLCASYYLFVRSEVEVPSLWIVSIHCQMPTRRQTHLPKPSYVAVDIPRDSLVCIIRMSLECALHTCSAHTIMRWWFPDQTPGVVSPSCTL